MTLSEEKRKVLQMPDDEVRQLFLYMEVVQTLERQDKTMCKNETNAYAQLQALIGLDEVKATVDKILALQRFYNIARLRGKNMQRPALHMQMVGNPGTAKTTVARLLAKIFKDGGLCSRGTFLEVGRADLISDHVGGTAPMVKAACRKAKGGVLFIDEAYSFFETGTSSYIPEFLSTLIAEMENNRNDLIVIFAGYPEKMGEFMGSNPGLKSRIPLTLEFPDYTETELVDISRNLAAQKGFFLSNEADALLLQTFKASLGEPNFGNARFARNLVEHAIMQKAERVQYQDCLRLSDEELFTLEKVDFSYNRKRVSSTTRRIGFAFSDNSR